jgi:hypothetical protein
MFNHPNDFAVRMSSYSDKMPRIKKRRQRNDEANARACNQCASDMTTTEGFAKP